MTINKTLLPLKRIEDSEVKKLMLYTGSGSLEELISGSLAFLSQTVNKLDESKATVVGEEHIKRCFVKKNSAASGK